MTTLPIEATILGLAGLLQVIQIALMAIPANLELGPGKTLGPRDPDRLGTPLDQQVSPITGRLHRAMSNHFEGLILFTIAVALVVWADASSPLTAGCAWTYLAARVLYIPAYAFGWVPWRSVLWAIGLLATLILICAALV
ncbi:MAPEG family protein [Ferrimonas balearica]|nr:MAPEG family protein [Ferrimonas balearica]